MILKNMKKESESMDKLRFSKKMRVLEVKTNNNLKVRVDFRDLNLIKRELIKKALFFNERVSV